jgi:hypothetical protein
MRSSALEPSRGRLPTRPSTSYKPARYARRRPERPDRPIFRAHRTYLDERLLPLCCHRRVRQAPGACRASARYRPRRRRLRPEGRAWGRIGSLSSCVGSKTDDFQAKSMRSSGLEPPRGILPTRPSTLYIGAIYVRQRPERRDRPGLRTHRTDLAWRVSPRCCHGACDASAGEATVRCRGRDLSRGQAGAAGRWLATRASTRLARVWAHSERPGRIVVAGKESDTVPAGTLGSIRRASGLEHLR